MKEKRCIKQENWQKRLTAKHHKPKHNGFDIRHIRQVPIRMTFLQRLKYLITGTATVVVEIENQTGNTTERGVYVE